ncbi:DedA family protein [Xylanimonas oleitrophica]|uniref:DedA family protein n=2 Tax=Xylanimonas oleitrophica TaxID=2607479 RepID=A0A2W5WVE2_9MICO|nr:DedA family protein [Xylanimonas oleitrophica]
MGDVGVGLLVLLEMVFPPIPSEVVLPFAGYLSQAGDLSLPWLCVWSTVGAWLGSLVYYGIGRAVGMARAVRLLAATRLVSRSDLERGAAWFERHGGGAVFVGRLIPGVRSVISLPAGAARMNLLSFSAFTLLGSGIWNTVLISLGAALGTQHERLHQYLGYVDYVVYTAVAVAVAVLVVRRVREHRREATSASGPASQ